MDRVVEEWMRSLPMRRPFGLGWERPGDDIIRVDEYREDDTEVIQAELPGIEPGEDDEVIARDGILRIDAERKPAGTTETTSYVRRELQHGRLTHTLRLPEGAAESDIAARYRNGLLEIRVPVRRQAAETAPTTIPISKE